MSRGRFPSSVYDVGDEPDARFSLANERTFLAWNRTALALIAGGVALEALGLDLHPRLRLIASLTLIGAGLLFPVLAWSEWKRAERALRLGSPLPGSSASVALAVSIVGVGALILLGLLLR